MNAEGDVKEAWEQVNALKERVEALEAQLSEARSLLQAYDADRSLLGEENVKMRTKVEMLEAEIAPLSSASEMASEMCIQLTEQVESLANQVEDQVAGLRLAEETVHNLEGQIQALKGQLEMEQSLKEEATRANEEPLRDDPPLLMLPLPQGPASSSEPDQPPTDDDSDQPPTDDDFGATLSLDLSRPPSELPSSFEVLQQEALDLKTQLSACVARIQAAAHSGSTPSLEKKREVERLKPELERLQVALRTKLGQLIAAKDSQLERMEASVLVSPAAKSAPIRREKVRTTPSLHLYSSTASYHCPLVCSSSRR